MKYLTILLFLLGGFLNQIEGQTIINYYKYIEQMETSSDPFQNSEAVRIKDFTSELYNTVYFNETTITLKGEKHFKRLVSNVENLDLQGYTAQMLNEIEVVIVLVREQDLIDKGQISADLRSKMPNLKNVLIIAEFPSIPSDFNSILTPNSGGYVPLLKVSLTH